MTHPGVVRSFLWPMADYRGLETVSAGKQVELSGTDPEEESSGSTRRLGQVSKQGSVLVRWLLVEAAVHAQRHDASWHRQYLRLSMTSITGGQVAIAHKLAVRLYGCCAPARTTAR